MVRLPEEQAGGHVAGDEGEVRAVVAVEDLLRAGGADCGHPGVVVVRVAAEEPGRGLVDVFLADDVGEVPVRVAHGGAEARHLAAAGPVAQADGHAVRILLLQRKDVVAVFLHIRAEFLLIVVVQVRDRVQGRADGAHGHPLQGGPDAGGELLQILGILRGNVQLERGGEAVALVAATEPAGGVGRHQFRGLLVQADGLLQGAPGEVRILLREDAARRGKHRRRLQVQARIAAREGPHVIRRAAGLAIRGLLVRLQARVVVQAVRDAGRVAQVVVVVQDRVGEGLGHVADLLGLRHEVQDAVLDVLEDVRHAVGPVQLHVALLLADERLVPLRAEALPQGDEVHHHADVGARLDVEVAGVEVTAHVQPGNELQGLEARVGGGTLSVQVEVVRGRRGLQVTLLERLAVPEAVGLVDRHVVHMDRDPDVARRHGDLVIDGRVDDEVPRADVAVLEEIDAGLGELGEVELRVVVFEEIAPQLDRTGEGLMFGAVGLHLPDGSLRLHLVLLVQFDHGDLGLVRDIAHLGEAHVRLADPARDGVRLHGPGDDLAGLAGREDGPEDIPAVLREHPAVVELDLAFAGDLHHPLRVVRGEEELVARAERQRLDELAGAPVVIRPVPLELAHLLRVGAHLGVAYRVAREAVGLAVHQIGLVPVLRGQELQVETRFARERLGNRLVQIDGDFHRLALGLDDDAGIEVVPVEAHPHLDGLRERIDHA